MCDVSIGENTRKLCQIVCPLKESTMVCSQWNHKGCKSIESWVTWFKTGMPNTEEKNVGMLCDILCHNDKSLCVGHPSTCFPVQKFKQGILRESCAE